MSYVHFFVTVGPVGSRDWPSFDRDIDFQILAGLNSDFFDFTQIQARLFWNKKQFTLLDIIRFNIYSSPK